LIHFYKRVMIFCGVYGGVKGVVDHL